VDNTMSTPGAALVASSLNCAGRSITLIELSF
jgi:hypothetical protein